MSNLTLLHSLSISAHPVNAAPKINSENSSSIRKAATLSPGAMNPGDTNRSWWQKIKQKFSKRERSSCSPLIDKTANFIRKKTFVQNIESSESSLRLEESKFPSKLQERRRKSIQKIVTRFSNLPEKPKPMEIRPTLSSSPMLEKSVMRDSLDNPLHPPRNQNQRKRKSEFSFSRTEDSIKRHKSDSFVSISQLFKPAGYMAGVKPKSTNQTTFQTNQQSNNEAKSPESPPITIEEIDEEVTKVEQENPLSPYIKNIQESAKKSATIRNFINDRLQIDLRNENWTLLLLEKVHQDPDILDIEEDQIDDICDWTLFIWNLDQSLEIFGRTGTEQRDQNSSYKK